MATGGEGGEGHQERLYFLLDQLQRMARELPTKYQQRIPYDLLAELAASLVQGQIFEIVNMLTEVQQVHASLNVVKRKIVKP